MNREIKFRGKRLDNSEWVFGYLYTMPIRNTVASLILTNDFEEEFRHGTRDYDLGFHLWKDLFPVDKETVGQLTGLYDKNGREVYEGDILDIKEFDNLLMEEFSDDDSRFDLFTIEEVKGELRAEYISPVVYNEGCFDVSTNGAYFNMYISSIWGDMKRSSPLFEFEVIGNIYDNPGLITNALKSDMLNLTEKKGGSYAE